MQVCDLPVSTGTGVCIEGVLSAWIHWILFLPRCACRCLWNVCMAGVNGGVRGRCAMKVCDFLDPQYRIHNIKYTCELCLDPLDLVLSVADEMFVELRGRVELRHHNVRLIPEGVNGV